MNIRSLSVTHGEAILLAAVFLFVQPVLGQRDDVNKLAVMKARGETSLTVGKVRYDMVVAENANAYLTDMTLLRTARETPDGWMARVYGPDGGLLMTGAFKDQQLRIPQGQFTFYHPNGNKESEGRFCNGGKVGVWQRWNQRGEQLSDRNYPDSCPVDTTGQHCWTSLSCRPPEPSR